MLLRLRQRASVELLRGVNLQRVRQCRWRHSSSSSLRDDAQFDLLVPALRAFYQAHQHWVVPQHFQIPHSTTDLKLVNAKVSQGVYASVEQQHQEQWPEDVRGVKLDVLLMRFLKAAREHGRGAMPGAVVDGLRELGFPLKRVLHDDDGWIKLRWEEVTFSALVTFRRLYGHMFVHAGFVVPYNDYRWPRPTWACNLGVKVSSMRKTRSKLTKYQTRDLNHVGFVWDVNIARWETWRLFFLPALRQFKQMHGHCNVPAEFVVSMLVEGRVEDESDAWSTSLEGYPLGKMMDEIRLGKHSTHVIANIVELAELGFIQDSQDERWNRKILPAVQHYVKIYEHSKVTRYFVVPETEEDGWPPELRGLQLGSILYEIEWSTLLPKRGE